MSATLCAWILALASEMWGSRPEPDAVTASTGTGASASSPFVSRYARIRSSTPLVSDSSTSAVSGSSSPRRNTSLVGPKFDPEL